MKTKKPKKQAIVYLRVASASGTPTTEFDTQRTRCLTDANAQGEVLLGEYRDDTDGFDVGPGLHTVLDHFTTKKWHGVTVIVDRLSRVSHDIDDVRDVAIRLNALGGRLRSVEEPRAHFSKDPRQPISLGAPRQLLITAAERFGAMTASGVRTKTPLKFAELSRTFLNSGFSIYHSFVALAASSSGLDLLPAAIEGMKFLQWTAEEGATQFELEQAFIRGFLGELKFHIDMKRGADCGVSIEDDIPF